MDLGIFSEIDIIARLATAILLGMTLGVERVVAGKTAGMRTYALVSMGAALFVIISLHAPFLHPGNASIDPLRVTAQVVVGIGFIGAGLIIFRNSRVRGLTTAAGLWVAAGIGLASGYALYMLAITATILTLVVFTVMWYVELLIKRVSSEPPSHLYPEDDDL